MEEDKAAALYESLSRQGLGAARFKQGLGFGGGATGAESTAGPISFTKAGADFSSEIVNAEQSRKEEDDEFPARRNKHESARVVQSIADKLRGKRSDHRDKSREENTDSEEERRSPRRRRSSDSEDVHARRRGGRPDSSSPKRRGRSGSEDSTEEGLAGRSRKSERERSPSHGESSEEDRARERRIADRRKEGKGKEGDRRSDFRREERSRKDGKSDPGRRGADRSTRERGVDTRRRSRSRSRDRGRGGVRGTDPERRHRSRERDHRSERNDGDRRRGDQRQEEPLENSRDRGDRRHGERSSRRDRSRSREGENRRGIRNGSAKGKAKEPAIDYAELIRGYENMNAAEKLKARTKYALSQTVVKDSARGMSTEWERFDFDTMAPLDEDAQQDFYGDDTKAADDASHLRNAGSTFGVTKAQAVREAEKQAAHDAAIFGRPVERSGDEPRGTKAPEKAPEIAPGGSEEDEEDRPVIVMEEAKTEEQETDRPNEVLAKPAVASWKEKALRAQQAQREAAKV